MDTLENILEQMDNKDIQFVVLVNRPDSSGNGSFPFTNCFLSSNVEDKLTFPLQNIIFNRNIKRFNRLSTNKVYYKHVKFSIERDDLIHRYVLTGLKFLRQLPCKTISKLWIKVIEPRKKTKYPYIGGNAMKPDWWPADVEHREPDHLQKPKRLRLMVDILLKVLPDKRNIEFIDDLANVTIATTLFKDDPQKLEVLKSLFDISRCLSDKVNKYISVVDIELFSKKPLLRKSSSEHISNKSSSTPSRSVLTTSTESSGSGSSVGKAISHSFHRFKLNNEPLKQGNEVLMDHRPDFDKDIPISLGNASILQYYPRNTSDSPLFQGNINTKNFLYSNSDICSSEYSLPEFYNYD